MCDCSEGAECSWRDGEEKGLSNIVFFRFQTSKLSQVTKVSQKVIKKVVNRLIHWVLPTHIQIQIQTQMYKCTCSHILEGNFEKSSSVCYLDMHMNDKPRLFK